MKHAEAADIVREAFGIVRMIPNAEEVRFAQAVAIIETSYGRGWKGAGVGSHNWGAIQAGSSWTGATFVYTDTHPNADGTSTPYRIAFRKYPSDVEGAADLLRQIYVRRPTVLAQAAAGSAFGVSSEMYATHYYEGFGKTPAERIRNHHRALDRAYRAVVAAESKRPQRPTLRRGSGYSDLPVRDFVRDWQRFIGCAADGLFGPNTEAATKEKQRAAGLVADGIVGPLTWELYQ